MVRGIEYFARLKEGNLLMVMQNAWVAESRFVRDVLHVTYARANIYGRLFPNRQRVPSPLPALYNASTH